LQNELTEALTSITDLQLIKKMLLNMSNRDISILMSLLEHTDNDTKDRWLDTYSRLLKY
jgi:hypothetical protein